MIITATMKNICCSLLLMVSLSAQATIFVVAYDPLTGAMGQAITSSGPAYVSSSRIQIREHGVGIVGGGGLGLCSNANAHSWLSAQLTADEIVSRISQRCDRKRPYYRLAVVTANGDIGLHLGPDGCNSHNANCGKLQGEHVGVIGGGLKSGVLQGSFDHFNSLDQAIPLECRLMSTLRRIYALGGEFKNFKVANIVVSYPARARENVWQAKGRESSLLRDLSRDLERSGVRCAD